MNGSRTLLWSILRLLAIFAVVVCCTSSCSDRGEGKGDKGRVRGSGEAMNAALSSGYENFPISSESAKQTTPQSQTNSLSVKQVQRMRELAVARDTPATQFLSKLFDPKSQGANPFAVKLHADLTKGKPDPAWSAASESTLRNDIAQFPPGFTSRLETSNVQCGPSVCEIQAAERFLDASQTAQDVINWQLYTQRLVRSQWWQESQLSTPTTIISVTPDGRPLFLTYFERIGKGATHP